MRRVHVRWETPVRTAQYYNEDGSGYFRGSGNDITKQQYNSLMDFVKSGYPVVLASGLVDGDKPMAKEVDSASY